MRSKLRSALGQRRRDDGPGDAVSFEYSETPAQGSSTSTLDLPCFVYVGDSDDASELARKVRDPRCSMVTSEEWGYYSVEQSETAAFLGAFARTCQKARRRVPPALERARAGLFRRGCLGPRHGAVSARRDCRARAHRRRQALGGEDGASRRLGGAQPRPRAAASGAGPHAAQLRAEEGFLLAKHAHEGLRLQGFHSRQAAAELHAEFKTCEFLWRRPRLDHGGERGYAPRPRLLRRASGGEIGVCLRVLWV